MAGHDGPLRVAEQARMDEREVAEVGEVLDLARGVARPPVRPAVHGHPGGILEFGNLGQRPARLLERDPDHPVALRAGERRGPGLGRHPGRVGELRDPRAGAVGAVAPAVVGAHDLVALDGAERERRAAVDAEIEECMSRAGAVAPEDERLAEQVDGEWLARRELAGVRDRCQQARRAGAWPATDGEVMARPYAAGSAAAATAALDARSERTDGTSKTPRQSRC